MHYNEIKQWLKDELNVEVNFQPVPENPFWGKESRKKFNFLIDLQKGGVLSSFYFSQGHRTPIPFFRLSIIEFEKEKKKLEKEYKNPDLLALLDCLIMDSRAVDQSFSEWCSELGYNDDSIKHLKIYENCIKQGEEFFKVFGKNDIEKIENLLDQKGYR